MKKSLYLSTAIVGVMIGGNVWAQCVSTQDCATLGYTETSCPNGGVKCPFGNKWYCNSITVQQCTDLGFKYECNGAYEVGGDVSCAGKYSSCSCKEGYFWSGTSCQYLPMGSVGNLFYCMGRVVGVKAPGMSFYVAMDDIGSTNWWDAVDMAADTNYCGYCSSKKATLPSYTQLVEIYNNKTNADGTGVNDLLKKYGGEQMSGTYWSSTAITGRLDQHSVNMSNGYVNRYENGNYSYSVRVIFY